MQIIRDYEQLRQAINARRVALRMKCLDVDTDAGLQNGYYAKICCGMRNFGPANLEGILRALNVELQLVERECVGTPRIIQLPKKVSGLYITEHDRLKKMLAAARENRWANIPPEKRRLMMAELARARWRKKRQKECIANRAKRKRKLLERKL